MANPYVKKAYLGEELDDDEASPTESAEVTEI
jgi:hypothetical protein